MSTFVERREAVIKFISEQIKKQGATPKEVSWAVTRIYFWSSKDVENLYKCINSDLDENVIREIVAHDFNGLANNDEFFLPKSTQFADVPEMKLKVPYIKPKSRKAEREVA